MALFDFLKGKKTAPTPAPQSSQAPPPPEDLAAELLGGLQDAYTDARGVHAETLLSALGALAGFGCQIAVREGLVKTGRVSAQNAFVVAETADGGTYYFGDTLNQPLLEAPMSVWRQVEGAAQKAGARELPDINDIAAFVAASLGGADFGTLRVADVHQPQEAPIDALRHQWAAAYAHIQSRHGDPLFTGWYFASAVQQLILKTKDVIDPGLAAKIVMESAVAMAKIDPKIIDFPVRSE